MKETLREKVEKLLDDLRERHEQLTTHIDQYKTEGDWEGAMKADIARRNVVVIMSRVEDCLNA